jgi:hypothetical protein
VNTNVISIGILIMLLNLIAALMIQMRVGQYRIAGKVFGFQPRNRYHDALMKKAHEKRREKDARTQDGLMARVAQYAPDGASPTILLTIRAIMLLLAGIGLVVVLVGIVW